MLLGQIVVVLLCFFGLVWFYASEVDCMFLCQWSGLYCMCGLYVMKLLKNFIVMNQKLTWQENFIVMNQELSWQGFSLLQSGAELAGF